MARPAARTITLPPSHTGAHLVVRDDVVSRREHIQRRPEVERLAIERRREHARAEAPAGAEADAIHADAIARRLLDVVVRDRAGARLEEPDPCAMADPLANVVDEAARDCQAEVDVRGGGGLVRRIAGVGTCGGSAPVTPISANSPRDAHSPAVATPQKPGPSIQQPSTVIF